MVSEENAAGFVLVFATILIVLVLIIMVSPQPALPSRSSYLKAEDYDKAINSGKVILLFFYRTDCKVCEAQAKILKDVKSYIPWIEVEWFNVAETQGDRKVKEEVEKYGIQAIPFIVARSSKGEKQLLGYLKKNSVIELANMVKP